jgi:O-antigen ligase
MTLVTRHGTMLLFAGLGIVLSAALLLEPMAWLGILVLPAMAATALLLRGGVYESKLAAFSIVFLSIFIVEAMFRSRGFTDKEVDFQVVLKVGIWCIMVLTSMAHAPRWAGQLLRPSNIPVLMFLGWLLLTTAVSPIPFYTVVCVLSIYAHILYCAYLFSSFDRVQIFATMVFALTLFCIISIVVYFAAPEFGHYIYWFNEQRYVSARMAGIAGSANGMGRLCAFGLILVLLYGREFRQIHPWFVRISVPIMVVSLLMTNSRTAMAMVVGLWAAVYLLRWRRMYLAVFGLSLALFAAVLIIPAGDDGLKLLARGGDVSEVTSLTGRSTIWNAIPALVEARPWTGYGYATSIIVLPAHEREVGFVTSHAHNLALQILLTTGWVGLILFSLSVLATGLRLAYSGDRTGLVMLAYVLLNGITEASAFSTLANICTVAFFIAVTLPPEPRNYENDHSR